MNVAKFNVRGQELNVEDSSARQSIGNLTELETTNKNNLVEAINEVKNNKNYGDSLISYDERNNRLTIAQKE